MNTHALPLVAAIAAALSSASPAVTAASVPVTSCADDGSAGTLRSAILTEAHDGDTIDMTGLTCGTITLGSVIDTSDDAYFAVAALTLVGPGRDRLVISGNDQTSLFRFPAFYGFPRQVTLRDLTIAHGDDVEGRYGGGGCVYATGDVTLDRVTITDCHARWTAEYPGRTRGGALLASWLVMTDSTISNSTAANDSGGTAAGGGAWVGGATLVDSSISGNGAIADIGVDGLGNITAGGGLYVAAAPLLLVNSTVSGNTVETTDVTGNGVGGGLLAMNDVQVLGSTISGNVADGDGGGIYKRLGAVYDRSVVVVMNSTIAGNSAGGVGGALASQRSATLLNATVASNDSGNGGALMFQLAGHGYNEGNGTLYLGSSIVAGNLAGAGSPFAAGIAADDTLTILGNSDLIVDAAPDLVLPPGTIAGDPMLLPLTWNGGPTQTMALAAGSPARDAGSNATGFTSDQRGAPWARTYGVTTDIGAYEVQPTPDVIFTSGFDD